MLNGSAAYGYKVYEEFGADKAYGAEGADWRKIVDGAEPMLFKSAESDGVAKNVNMGPNSRVPVAVSSAEAVRPAPIMKMPARRWHRLSVSCAGSQRSATMPMRAGMKIDTNPCTV